MDIFELLTRVRVQKPLVHHITNWVTIYDCANIVKVLGASPVMAHAKEEAANMTALASSLVLNIGTLTPRLVESMKIASQTANQKEIPVVLDVCGAGATPLRDEKALELIENTKINIIKGNSSEIARIAGENIQTKGVDAVAVEKDLIAIATSLASKYDCTVVITGREDIITNAQKHNIVSNGHQMMSQIVGTGCMATSVIGTFAGIEKNLLVAATAGLCCFEIAAQLAAKDCRGPGSFKQLLFDNAYNLDKNKIEKWKQVIS